MPSVLSSLAHGPRPALNWLSAELDSQRVFHHAAHVSALTQLWQHPTAAAASDALTTTTTVVADEFVSGNSLRDVSANLAQSTRWVSSTTLSAGRLFAFMGRLTKAILHFILSRLKRSPLFMTCMNHMQTWMEMYTEYDANNSMNDSLGAKILDRALRVTRMFHRIAIDAIKFANWTLNPVLFIRRLYRICVGLIVLYCLHSLWSYLSDRCRRSIEWFRIENGIWNGDVKCMRKRELDTAMAQASTYEEWKSAAQELDELESERMIWKYTKPSSEYQFKRIARNVESIRNLIATHKAQQEKIQQERAAQEKLKGEERGSLASTQAQQQLALLDALADTTPPPSSSHSAAASLNNSLTSSSSTSSPPSFALSPPASDPQALMRFLRSRLLRNIGNITNTRLYFDESSSHFVSSFPDIPPATKDQNGNPIDASSAAANSLAGVSTAAAAAAASSSYTSFNSPLLPCRVGTKDLIESYHSEVIRGLETILHDTSIPASTKLSFFRETRHAYGRSALLLNGGANLGMLHLGVVKALLEIDVLPQIISGSSVGAIFAALICSRTDSELSKIGSSDFLSLEFPSVQGSLRRKLRRFLEEGILMDISALIHCVRSHIGDLTFEQAYQRYGRILNIVVTPIHMAGKKKRSNAGMGELDEEEEQQHSSEPILLNYLTAPSVLIWSAACASCAVPHLYAPVELLAKNPQGDIIPYFGSDNDEQMRFGAGCVDGAVVKMDVAMDRLRTLFNCNNFIVSQLNLSLLPFIFGGTSFSSASPLQKLLRYLAREIYQRVTNICCLFGITSASLSDTNKGWGRYSFIRFCLYVHSLTSQSFKGDITLVPPVSWRDYSQLLENPSTKRLNDCVDVARRYTWTKGSLIKSHCVVEFALDRCVRKCRSDMGLAALPSVSAAFAHPNRSYSSLGSGPSPFPVQYNNSPSSTPHPQSLHWSKKLNARALQPSRKASFTSDTQPNPGSAMMMNPNNLPILDLGMGRNSPSGPLMHARNNLSGSNFITPTPVMLNGSNGFPAYTSPSNAPRHRSNSSASTSSPMPAAIPLGVVSPTQAMRPTGLIPSSGIEFVGGSMRPPPALSIATMPRRMSGSSSLDSSPRSPHDLPAGDGSSTSSSNASSSPNSPIPADSSHDDLQHAPSNSSSTTSSSQHSRSSALSTHKQAQVTPALLATARKLDERRAGGGIRQLASNSKATLVISPAASTITTSSSNGTQDSSLLRSVPSVPGSSLSPNLSSTNSASSSTATLLPSSISNSKLVDDSFNRGVMAHLNQQLMFAVPPTKKLGKKANQHPAKAATTNTAAAAASSTPTSDSPVVKLSPTSMASCASTSVSEASSCDDAHENEVQGNGIGNGGSKAPTHSTSLEAC